MGVMNSCSRKHRVVMAGIRAALVAHLALWLGFFPLFQALHLQFVSHDHRYCALHEQIEDVPRSELHEFLGDAERSSDERSLRGVAVVPAEQAHIACILSNCHSSRDPILRTEGPPPMVREPGCTTTASRDHGAVRSISILLIAPKQSPPSLA